METTVTHRSLIREARKEIRGLKRPPTMRADVWRGVLDLLDALAGYLPEVWPSQRTLARRLQVSQSAIQRRVNAARNAGLIVTTTHDHPAWRDGLDYRLACLSTPLQAALSRVASRVGSDSEGSPAPAEQDRSSLPSSKGGTPVGACGPEDLSEQDNVIPMSRYFDPAGDDPDVSTGADPRAPLPQYRVPPVDQGARLAAIFDECWVRMVRKHREWAGMRSSSRPIAVQYIKGVMLQQVASVEIAEAYIRSYAPAVAEGRAQPGPKVKNAFQHFTTWWGSEEIEDPSLARSRKAEYDEIIDAYRKQTGSA